MRRLAWICGAALVASFLLTAAGCSGGTKAGGKRGGRTIVLTMANQWSGGQPDQLVRFANQVAKRSGGTVRIEFKGNWRAGDVHQELDTIRDVRAGKVDLAWVGARAWDWLGIRTFDPLLAPLLVDSYPVEQAVFARGIPPRMLRGLSGAGVVPVGVLPGPLRKVLGVSGRFVRPADFRGRIVGVQGLIAAETMRALGGRPRQEFSGEGLNRLDGIESQLSGIAGNSSDTTGHYLSVDLNLWPRPLVIFASSNVFRSLSTGQQDALRGGAAAAVPLALSASRQEDVSAMRTLCARGKLTLIDLTHVQLQAFQNAVAPVYRRLERDASTRRTIREIEAMKRGLPVASNPRCAATSTTPTAPAATLLDGAWQMTVSASDVRDKADAGTYRFVLHRGRLQSSASGPDGSAHDSGTYRVDGGLVVFHITAGHDIGETWTYRWNIYRGALTFRRAPTGAAQGPANPTFAPWHRA